MSHVDLPVAEFGYPGPLRDRLIAAILTGAKTSTTSLLAEYELTGEQLPEPGRRYQLIDSAAQPVGVVETLDVHTVRLAEVDLAHVIDEGEGFTEIAAWRDAHQRTWNSLEARAAHGEIAVNDNTLVVLERFRFLAP
jgi:uncharacterized protein YhfF